ncbi:MAG: L-fucose:H+ symporter permease, partial [Cytophagales bacterium]|nr:L-fucose:H+ symporter permease [Cytophagales bacterium]
MEKTKYVNKKFLLPFVILTSLFFVWGLAANMTDTLLAAFKKIMSMTDYQTSFIQLAYYGSYALLAFPAAIFIKHTSYKSGVLLGLGLFILGSLCFYPASQTQVYDHFLIALFILAGGLSIVETSANPYIYSLGDEESGTRRLNLAQAFNPIGSISGVVLSKFVILSGLMQVDSAARAAMSEAELTAMKDAELSAVMGPYVSVALFLIVIWVVIWRMNMPAVQSETKEDYLSEIVGRLLKKSNYKWGVVAQFFYMGAQIGVWSYTIRFVQQEIHITEEAASSYYIASLILFSSFRFVFTALMKFFKPERLLIASAILGGAATIGAMSLNGIYACISLIMISAFMSLMFPTIFGMTVRGLGKDTKIGGSGLVMALLGGAVLTSVQGRISDFYQSIQLSFVVPLICFIAVAMYGFYY